MWHTVQKNQRVSHPVFLPMFLYEKDGYKPGFEKSLLFPKSIKDEYGDTWTFKGVTESKGTLSKIWTVKQHQTAWDQKIALRGIVPIDDTANIGGLAVGPNDILISNECKVPVLTPDVEVRLLDFEYEILWSGQQADLERLFDLKTRCETEPELVEQWIVLEKILRL